MADARIEAVAGLRVEKTAFDDDHRTFTIIGSLEFGRVADGLEVCLPLANGEYLYAYIYSVADLESSPGSTRIALSLSALEAGRERLEKLRIAGEPLHLVRRTFASSDDGLSTIETVGRSLLGTVGLLILGAAICLPPLLGDGLNGKSIAWMIAGVVAFITAIILVSDDRRWSLPVLMLACVFFFTSCGANLHLHLD